MNKLSKCTSGPSNFAAIDTELEKQFMEFVISLSWNELSISSELKAKMVEDSASRKRSIRLEATGRCSDPR